MTFISYAQNGEDVMLLRALRHVENGFYIDVGAQDPIEDSVTKAFYDRGWRGINLDPVDHWYQKLLQDRPRDINLRVAASDHRGSMHLYEVADTGLSTADSSFAAQYLSSGRTVAEYEVECRTLDEICEEHHVGDIHFLKIDVEGVEAVVLGGLSLDRIRPWIIVVEAMLPNSQTPAWADWDPLLVGHRYGCVYEDGLNRFYLADERSELKEAFRFPPNIMDDYVPRRIDAALKYLHDENARRESALDELRAALRQSTVARLDQERVIAELQCENERREAALSELRAAFQCENERREVALSELRAAFASQTRELQSLQTMADQLHGQIGTMNLALAGQREEILVRDRIIASSAEVIEALHNSTSWRVTAPLRWSSGVLRRGLLRSMRPIALWVRPALQCLARVSWLHALITRAFGADSRAEARIRWYLFGPPAPPDSLPNPIRNEQMTRSAARVLGEIEKRKHTAVRDRKE